MELSESALVEFFTECDEILQRFSSKLSLVEKEDSVGPETIGALYRDMHTMKGSAQLFGFRLISQVAHSMEAALEPIRRLHIQIPPKLIDALFLSIDLIDRIVKDSSVEKKERSKYFDQEIRKVVPLLLSAASDHFGGELNLIGGKPSDLSENRVLVKNSKSTSINIQPSQSDLECEQKNDLKLQVESLKPSQIVGTIRLEGQGTIEKELQKETPKEHSESFDSNTTVRIHVSLLDKLMTLVGEMVLVRNQMLQYSQKHNALEFLNLSQRLDIITSELQGDVMKTRMQPIGTILSKFQRLVRDLGKELGKQIDLKLEGTETELDKTLLEAIKDPLTHIIRNSCDHGLETTEQRLKLGKSTEGHILLRAFHEGGHVIIEIVDDGQGLNSKVILEKAVENKIITQDQASKLTDREIGNLIFAPGFSTAEKVTAVSGRGVGMDVVKTNLERIGGQVELQSQQGRGITVRLRIPLTLAIVPALVIRAGGEQFAIPQVKLAELVRVEKDGPGQKIESLHGKPVLRLRGHLLSLLDLREMMGIQGELKKVDAHTDCVNIVVLNGDGEVFGLIVDEIKDTADIVVKPLTNFLKKLQIYSGATIMGDGSVSLILDVAGIAERGSLFQKTKPRELQTETANKAQEMNQDAQDFLFFKLNSAESYCLPLCLVHRLEEFPLAEVQCSGLQRMVKYRGSILPIISLNNFFELDAKQSQEVISLIVVQKSARLFGIEVNEVIDIIHVQGAIEDVIKETPGILGSIIVEKNVATVIDVFAILDDCAGTPREQPSTSPSYKAQSPARTTENIRILFAEDTVFFVKQVKSLLEKNGYSVTHAANGEQAWQMLLNSKPGEYQMILSDIEMPKMTGFELAEKVRSDSRFNATPMIALTTSFREVDRERGLNVGFTRYLEKLRPDELLEALQEILGGQANDH